MGVHGMIANNLDRSFNLAVGEPSDRPGLSIDIERAFGNIASMTGAPNPPREQLVLLNEQLQGRGELQSGELEGLDRKASTMLAGTGVVLGLVVNNVDKFQAVAAAPRCVFFGSLFLLAVGIVAGVVALWPRRIKVVPSARGLVEGYYARSHDDTLANLVSVRLRALEENKNLSKVKIWALRAQMSLFAAGGIGLTLSIGMKEWI